MRLISGRSGTVTGTRRQPMVSAARSTRSKAAATSGERRSLKKFRGTPIRRPGMEGGTGWDSAMTFMTSAASRTVRVSGPPRSSERPRGKTGAAHTSVSRFQSDASANKMPARESSRRYRFPWAKKTRSAATAPPEPPLDPPGIRAVSCGFRTRSEVRIVASDSLGKLVHAGLR